MTSTARPPEAPTSTSPVARKGLKIAAIGLLSSVVIGVASTAPGYSLAATLGYVSQEVGTQAPIIMLLAFVPMLFISYAYKSLNSVDPDCGTSFTWVARAFGRHTGWLTGWVIVAADIIVMANLAQIAGIYSLNLIGAHGLAENLTAQLAVGCAWILLMTLIAYLGIELSARTQVILLGIELFILALFAVVALVRVYSGHGSSGSIHVSWSWFNPFAGGLNLAALSAGLLLAVFIYWGWDSAVTVNEETEHPTITPGRAAVIATVVLLVTYLLVTVAAQSFAGVGDTGIGLSNPDNASDVLSVVGSAVMGSWGVKLLLLAVLSSAAASTQTTILPTARTTLSMAAYKAAPKAFGEISPKHLTPGFSTWAMGISSIAFFAGLTWLKPDALGDLIASIGLLIAFYYGLTGFAAPWYFRRHLFASARTFLEKGLLPVLGGLILFALFVYAAKTYYAADYGVTTFFGVGGVFVLGIGSILLGIVLMIIWNIVAPAYFTGRTMRSDVVVVHTGEAITVGHDVGPDDDPRADPGR